MKASKFMEAQKAFIVQQGHDGMAVVRVDRRLRLRGTCVVSVRPRGTSLTILARASHGLQRNGQGSEGRLRFSRSADKGA